MKLFLVALLATSVVFAAAPRAYVSLASVSAGVGYHALETTRHEGTQTSWYAVGLQLLEGSWFLNPRFGIGLRVIDFAVSPISDRSDPFYPMRPFVAAVLLPTACCVLHRDARGFGYLDLGLMPLMPFGLLALTGDVSSALTLDYGYVPLPPWPLEGRIRLAAQVFTWSGPHVAWQLSAGIRAGLSWWFMRHEPSQM